MASGKMLRDERRGRAWTQQEMADKMHIHRSEEARIEAMFEIPPKRISTIDKIFGGPEWRQQTAGHAVEPRAEVEHVMSEMDRRWRECVERIETLHADTLRIEKRLGALESFRGDAISRSVVKRKKGRRK